MDSIKRILRYTKPYRLYLYLALLCSVISVGLTLYSPILIGRAIDYIIGPNNVDFPNIFRILIQLAAAVIFGGLFQWFLGLCTNVVTYRTIRDIRLEAFHKLNTVPLKR